MDIKKSEYKIFRDPKTGLLFEQGPVIINEIVSKICSENFRTHQINDYCDKEWTHPLLSEFIADLAAIYKKYGDGYICNSANPMTHELFGSIEISDKEIEGLPSMNGETKYIRYFDIT